MDHRLAVFASIFAAALATSCAPTVEPGLDDQQVIDALREAGSDLRKPHPIEFYFVELPDEAAARGLAGQIGAGEWRTRVHSSEDGSTWVVVASTRMVPEITALSRLSTRFNGLVAQAGGDYDGWEAEVTP